jgi:hypothetical protein
LGASLPLNKKFCPYLAPKNAKHHKWTLCQQLTSLGASLHLNKNPCPCLAPENGKKPEMHNLSAFKNFLQAVTLN